MKSIGDRLLGLKRFLHPFARRSDAEVTRHPNALPFSDEQRMLITQFSEDRVLFETFFDCMDPKTKQVCSWRLQGFTISEIARVLNLSADVLSERYVRGLKTAADKVHASRKGCR